MSEVRSIAETKAHLSELVARAGTEHERITVTVHGRPTAVLLAVDDLEALEETLAVLSDSAALRAIGEADAELARVARTGCSIGLTMRVDALVP